MAVALQVLFDNGCHLGHPAEKWHPRMKQWIYGVRDGIHIFDLEKTAAQLEKARARIQELKELKKSVVVVATKKQAAELVQDLAETAGLMYVVNRWPGGLITNWEQVRKSIKRMNDIEDGLAHNKFQDLTKYERLLLEKELARLERLFGGLKNLHARPDALFVVDAQKEKNAVHEALKEKVEVIAMVDTNTDPTGISLVIPTNDDAISSIRLIVSEALGVRREAPTVRVAKSAAKEEKQEEKAAEEKEDKKSTKVEEKTEESTKKTVKKETKKASKKVGETDKSETKESK
ncbi:30S ribosomal protein S2 [bacterium]|nr:30S ribosomal protein S2 [bacterium]